MKFEDITDANFDAYNSLLRSQMDEMTALLVRVDFQTMAKLKLLNVADMAKTYFSLVQEFYIGSFRDVADWFSDYFCAYNELKETLFMYSGYGFVVDESAGAWEKAKGGEES